MKSKKERAEIAARKQALEQSRAKLVELEKAAVAKQAEIDKRRKNGKSFFKSTK